MQTLTYFVLHFSEYQNITLSAIAYEQLSSRSGLQFILRQYFTFSGDGHFPSGLISDFELLSLQTSCTKKEASENFR